MAIAFTLFGLSEFLTGALVAVAIVVGAIFLLIVWDEISWPWSRNYETDYLTHRRTRMTRGVLICDWVDTAVLTSIARQKKIELEPDRLERGEMTTTSGGLEGGSKPARARFGRERKRDERAFYELTKDPNALLAKVLRKLYEDSVIDDDLDQVWGTGLLSGELLDNIIEVARDKPQMEAAREAVMALQASALRQRKVEEWRNRVGPRFALIESEWSVTRFDGDPGLFELRLRKLSQTIDSYPMEAYEVGAAPVEQVDMPDELAVVVQLQVDRLTDQGTARLSGAKTLNAGVLGTTARFDESAGVLSITPIAVFARIEG
jgi:hypothetical protein